MSPGDSDSLRGLAYQHSAVRSIVRSEWQHADRNCLTKYPSVPMETGGYEDLWHLEHERAVYVVEQAFAAIVEPLAARVSEPLGDDLLSEWSQLRRAVKEPRTFWKPVWERGLEDLDRRVRAHVLRTAGSPAPNAWPETEKELDVFRVLLAEELLNGRMTVPPAPRPVGVDEPAPPAPAVHARRRRSTGQRVKDKPLTKRQEEALDMLLKCDGSKTETAKRLGISRQALDDRLLGVKLRGALSKSRSVRTRALPHDQRGQANV